MGVLFVLLLPQEVFRSDFHGVGRMSQVVGRASVLHYKDYSKMVPMVTAHAHTHYRAKIDGV